MSLPPFAKCITYCSSLLSPGASWCLKAFFPALWDPSKERPRFTRSTKLQPLVIILSTIWSHNWVKGESSVTIFMLMFIAGFPDHFHLWVKCYVFHCLNRKLSDIFVNNRKDLQIIFSRKLTNFWSGRVYYFIPETHGACENSSVRLLKLGHV